MDISVDISPKPWKVVLCTHEIGTEGSMSQIFDIGHSLDFIECRN